MNALHYQKGIKVIYVSLKKLDGFLFVIPRLLKKTQQRVFLSNVEALEL